MIELTDYKGRVVSCHETVAGMSAVQLASSTVAPLTELFSRPVCYKGIWTAHYKVNGGHGGSYRILIPKTLAHKIREAYAELDGVKS